jgi:hypothetical protein
MVSIVYVFHDQKRHLQQELAIFSAMTAFGRFSKELRILHVKRIEDLFVRTYLITVGALDVSKNYSQKLASACFSSIKETIAYFVRFRRRLEEVEFLGSKELDSKSNLVLDSLYDLQIQIRMKTFSGQPRKSTDPRILDCLATMSKEAIESRLNRQ